MATVFFPSHIDMRRPFIDYVHRATVLSILGLAVRTFFADTHRGGVCGSRAPCTLAGLAMQTGYVECAYASFPTVDGIATP